MAGIEEDEPEKYDYQTPVLCGDCKDHKNVNSYCRNCVVDLCDKCKARTLHKKHRVLPRTHPDVIRARKTKKSPCKRHPEKLCFTYCIKCKVPCCVTCATNDHSGHSFSELDDAAKEAKKTIKSNIDGMETVLCSYQHQHEAIEDGISQYNQSFKKTISESKARFQSLRDEIDRAERAWIKEMNQVKFNDMFHMNGMKSELDRKIRITTDTIASCRNALEHSHDLELLSCLSENIDPACLQSLKITLPALVHFQPSQYKLPIVTELIGRTRQEENKTLHTPKQLKRTGKFIAIRKFESSMIRVEQIKTITNKRADTLRHTNTGMWVNSGSNMSLKLYDENINEMKQKNSVKLNFHITDMALDSLENIIATDARNKRIIRIDLLGEFNTVCSTAPLVPRGVCINDGQQIVVGVGTSVGKPLVKLLVYSTDITKIEKEIETGGSGEPLFKGGIFQVKQMEKGDYVVSHFRSIICLNLEGIHRWEYRLQCICYGLVCDQYDNIIAADHMNHTVHLLNCDGMLIKTLLTREDGIYYPYCLSIDKHGYLWIGQDKNLKVIQYLR